MFNTEHMSAQWIRDTLGAPITKAYAVAKEAIRRDAISLTPASATWTLYNPLRFVDGLFVMLSTREIIKEGVAVHELDESVHILLEENGFSKAVRIREELIKWKTRLIDEDRELNLKLKRLKDEERRLKERRSNVKEQLTNVRNILRLPREHVKEVPTEY